MSKFAGLRRLGRHGLLAPAIGLLAVGLLAGAGAVAEPPPWSTAARGKAEDGKNPGVGRCDGNIIGSVSDGSSTIGSGGEGRAAMVGGAIIGALVGGTIGGKMDQFDQHCIGRSLEHGDDGKTIWWENSEAKARYGVTPMRSFENSAGRYCREYRTTALLDGRVRQAFGTACRQPDGAWQLVS